MNKCDIKIVFDSNNSVYKLNSIITGKIVIKVNKDFKCRKVLLDLLWRTDGAGSQDTETVKQISLSIDESLWKSETVHSFPFKIDAPNGPVSYNSNDLKIYWLLKAKVKTYLYNTIEKEKTFTLLHMDDDSLILKKYNYGNGKTLQEEKVFEKEYVGNSPYIILFLIFTIPSLILLFSGILEKDIFRVILSLPFIIIGVKVIYSKVINKIALLKLGKVKIALNKDYVKPGDRVTCNIAIEPTESIYIKNITIVFNGAKELTDTTGESDKTYTNILHEEKKVIIENGYIAKYDTFSEEVDFLIPNNAKPTFISYNNKLTWYFTVIISTKSRPKWEDKFDILVCP